MQAVCTKRYEKVQVSKEEEEGAGIVVGWMDRWREREKVFTCPFQVNGSVRSFPSSQNKKNTFHIKKFSLPSSSSALCDFKGKQQRGAAAAAEEKGKNEFAVIFLMEFLCGTRRAALRKGIKKYFLLSQGGTQRERERKATFTVSFFLLNTVRALA
jgi:hypothetical protein